MRSVLKYCIVWGLIVGSLLIGVQHVSAQDKKQLQASKQKIEAEIKYTNRLLNATRKSKKSSMNELVMLDNKISHRQDLIQTIGNEISQMERQIVRNGRKIDALSQQLEALKKEYAAIIYHSYKNRNAINRLMFLFASEDFNQAYQRLKYFQQYSDYRKRQGERIVETQEEIRQKNVLLSEIKSDKIALSQQKESEKIKLTREKQEKSKTVQALSRKEKKLNATRKAKERAARKLQNAIQEIIAEEIRLAEAEAKRAGAGKAATDFALTPSEMALSNNFSSNKKKLPWPTEKGIVSETFGEHAHPVLKTIKVKNDGINIMTHQGAYARAVFKGKVTKVMSIPSFQNVVMIRHGEYLTVYANLDEVVVKSGELVETKQPIGKIHTNQADAKTELHFRILKGKSLQNPLYWLVGRK